MIRNQVHLLFAVNHCIPVLPNAKEAKMYCSASLQVLLPGFVSGVTAPNLQNFSLQVLLNAIYLK